MEPYEMTIDEATTKRGDLSGRQNSQPFFLPHEQRFNIS